MNKLANTIYGGDGDDGIVGGAGPDLVWFGAGRDVFGYFNSKEIGDTLDLYLAHDFMGFVKSGFKIDQAVALVLTHAFDFEQNYFVSNVNGRVVTQFGHGDLVEVNEFTDDLFWDADGTRQEGRHIGRTFYNECEFAR